MEDSNINTLGLPPLTTISNINVIRANLSAIWTLVYQIADIVVFLALSVVPLYFHMTFVETLNGLVILLLLNCAHSISTAIINTNHGRRKSTLKMTKGVMTP